VVATSVGGVPDSVENGKSGILVETGDYKELSQTIIGLLRSDEKAAAMGESGRRRISKEFTWSRIAARYEAAFYATTVSQNESRQALRLE
jgi:glycosyltransferase involved in cell wall biosynthesis